MSEKNATENALQNTPIEEETQRHKDDNTDVSQGNLSNKVSDHSVSIENQSKLENNIGLSEDKNISENQLKNQLDEFQLRFCSTVLTKIKKNSNAGPFLKPVDPVALGVPDYLEKITNPMDLSTIRSKLDNKMYNRADQFYADMKLMFNNCYTYNGRQSPISLMATALENQFDKVYDDLPRELPKKPVKKKKEDEPEVKRRQISMSQEEYDIVNYMFNELEKPKNKKIIWPFERPVGESEVPGYYEIIKSPMDLSTMKNKFENGKYSKLSGVINDFKLIVSNCKLFNAENTEIYKLGCDFENLYNSLNKLNPDNEIEELRKKISELKSKLVILERNKATESGRKVYDIGERERIGKVILNMSKDESDRVVEIIQRNCSNFQYVGNDEIEVNMHTLPDHVLNEIEEFTKRIDSSGKVEGESSTGE